MKTLYLCRHAKTSGKPGGAGDSKRRLSPDGIRDARAMGRHLINLGVSPERVLCSTATRAIQTLQNAGLPSGMNTEFVDDLYTANPDSILDLVRTTRESISTVMVIGHNPSIAELACTLTGQHNRDLLSLMTAKFPAGAMAGLRFMTVSWAKLSPGAGNLHLFVTPRDLRV